MKSVLIPGFLACALCSLLKLRIQFSGAINLYLQGIPSAKRQKRSINTNQEASSSTNVDNLNQTTEMPTWKIETNNEAKNVEEDDNVNRRNEEKAKKLLDDYNDDCEMEEKEIPR